MLDMWSGTKMERCNRKQSNTFCCMVCQSGRPSEAPCGLGIRARPLPSGL